MAHARRCSRRFAVSSVANVQTNRIAFPGEFSCGIPGAAAYNAVAKRVTNSEADWLDSTGGLSSDITISSTPERVSGFAICASSCGWKSNC